MAQKRFSRQIKDGNKFIIVAELTGGPNYNFKPIEHFMQSYKETDATAIPDDFDFVGITLPENPGGVANINPSDVLTTLKMKDLLGDLDFIPHISCKDRNSDGLISALVGYRQMNVESILVLTGDKPASAKGIFELEAIGMLALMKKINNDAFIKTKPENVDKVHQFCPGAAVSQFKYTEASQMQQYYKMEKKIRSGAEFIITQVGWDWRKSLELFQYMQHYHIDTPVIGNVYFLTTTNPAPRLMHDIKLPGCFVSDEFLEQLQKETFEEHMERAAQQIAMYRAMGAAGVDLGGVHDFEVFKKILARAAEIGTEWEQYKDNLYWPAKETFYLYDENGWQVALTTQKKTLNHKFFNFMHRAILDSDYRGFHIFAKVMKILGTEKNKGCIYKLFNASEKSFKYLLFECEECGDCFLPENFSLCTIGGCEKGMDNAPCGDATVDGYCGNNLERICIGERIYDAAAAENGGLTKLRQIINPPRMVELEHTSSILNYLFGRDHTKANPLLSIGESINAAIPKVGAIMKQVKDTGEMNEASPQVQYLKSLIEVQSYDGADFIAVYLDSLSSNPDEISKMMGGYVDLIQATCETPICINSEHEAVLHENLKRWYDTDQQIGRPMLCGITERNADALFKLRKHWDFDFTCRLSTEYDGTNARSAIDDMFSQALRIAEKAKSYGFSPKQMVFEVPAVPLVKDIPTESGITSKTYISFETMKKIRSSRKLKGVHLSANVVISCIGMPGRTIGICRAYVDAAMKCGLDAGVVNPSHKFGMLPAAADLVRLVESVAKIDGSDNTKVVAEEEMAQFLQANQKKKAG